MTAAPMDVEHPQGGSSSGSKMNRLLPWVRYSSIPYRYTDGSLCLYVLIAGGKV